MLPVIRLKPPVPTDTSRWAGLTLGLAHLLDQGLGIVGPERTIPLLRSPLLLDHSDVAASLYADEATDHPTGVNRSD